LYHAGLGKESAVKVRVDATRCEGYAKCNELLPSLFKLDEWRYAYVEGEAEVPVSDEELARQALADCRTCAISADE
jgi:ferredoxin